MLFDFATWLASLPVYAYASLVGALEAYRARAPPGTVALDVRNVRYHNKNYLALVHYDPPWKMYGAYYLDEAGGVRVMTLKNSRDPACGEAIFANVEPMSETIKMLRGVLTDGEIDRFDWNDEQLALIEGMRDWLSRQ